MGKSWLLGMFAHEARNRKLPVVQIDFAHRQAYDAFTLIRRCRDMLGTEYFGTLNQVIHAAANAHVSLNLPSSSSVGPISISLGSANVLDQSSVMITDIGNLLFNVQADSQLQRQAIETHLNTSFFECLMTLCLQTKVVFLFDTYELTSVQSDSWVPTAADHWIVTELLERIRDGRLPNAVAVLAGQRMRRFSAEWNDVIYAATLGPLERNDVKEYLCKRLGLSMITDGEIERLWQVGASAPQMLGLFGDRLRQSIRSQKSFDEE